MAETDGATTMENKETERVAEMVPEEESGAATMGLWQKAAAMQT